METVVKTFGVVESGGHIATVDLPFTEGEKVAVVVWPSEAPVEPKLPRTPEERIDAFNEYIAGLAERHPNLPVLSDEAVSRDAIYEDRGL